MRIETATPLRITPIGCNVTLLSDTPDVRAALKNLLGEENFRAY